MARSKVPGEKFKTERIFLLGGLATSALVVAVYLIFLPGILYAIPGWLLGIIFAILIMAASFGFWGLILGFRHHTPKLMSGNRVWEVAFNSMIKLQPDYYPIDKQWLVNDPTLGQEEREALEREVLTLPGTNERGERVDVRALGLGGFRWAQFFSYNGEDGYVLFFGQQWIEFYENVFVPRTLEWVDHSTVDQKLLTQLEAATAGRAGAFHPYETLLYICGDIDPDYAENIRKNPEVRALVMESIGIAGIAREFADLVGKLDPSVRAQMDPKALIPQVREWLQAKNLYVEAVTKGYASPVFWRNRAAGLQGALTRKDHEIDDLRDQGEYYRRQLTGQAQRGAGVYSGGYARSLVPPPRVAEDQERIPGRERVSPYQEG